MEKFENIEYILVERNPGVEFTTERGDIVKPGDRVATLRTKDGNILDTGPIDSVGVVDSGVEELWQRYWVKPQGLAILMKEAVSCYRGRNIGTGRETLMCGERADEYLLDEEE